MSLSNPNRIATKQDLIDLRDAILPYLDKAEEVKPISVEVIEKNNYALSTGNHVFSLTKKYTNPTVFVANFQPLSSWNYQARFYITDYSYNENDDELTVSLQVDSPQNYNVSFIVMDMPM